MHNERTELEKTIAGEWHKIVPRIEEMRQAARDFLTTLATAFTRLSFKATHDSEHSLWLTCEELLPSTGEGEEMRLRLTYEGQDEWHLTWWRGPHRADVEALALFLTFDGSTFRNRIGGPSEAVFAAIIVRQFGQRRAEQMGQATTV